MENAVVYARYSSHAQNDRSIEDQFAEAHKYAAAKGYRIIHEYCDRAISGKTDNRAGFQKMLADTAKKQFTVIIIWKVDRFGRNREEIALNKIRCKRNGVRVEYVTENLPEGKEGVILESVFEGLAEYYNLQHSENVHRGMDSNARHCMSVGGPSPLGYKVNPSTKKFEIDEDTAPVVREIFSRYAGGQTVTDIITWLNGAGIKTSRGGPYTKNSLSKLLKNEKYIGVYVFKDKVRVEGGVPSIVDADVFQRAQEMLKVNRRAPAKRWHHSDYILTDKLFCGNCGSPMVGESGFSHTGTKHCYYSCVKKRRDKACSLKSVRQEQIEGEVLDAVIALLQDDDLLEFIADKTFEYYEQMNQTQSERRMIESQLQEVSVAQKNIVKAVEMGMVSQMLMDRMGELEKLKEELTGALSELQLSESIKLTKDHILFFLYQFRNLDYSDRKVQKRLIQTFVNAVYVYSDKIKLVFNYSSDSNTITLPTLTGEGSEKGFVCRLPTSTFAKKNPSVICVAQSRWILSFGNLGEESTHAGRNPAEKSDEGRALQGERRPPHGQPSRRISIPSASRSSCVTSMSSLP